MNKFSASKNKSSASLLGREKIQLEVVKDVRFWPIVLSTLALASGATFTVMPLAVDAAKSHAAYAARRGGELAGTNARQSIAYYQIASWLDRNNQSYSQKLSSSYLEQGLVSKALEALNNASGQEDQTAMLLLKLDRPDEAVSVLQKKVQMAPSGESYLLLTRAYIENGRYRDAESSAEMAGEYPSVKDQGIVLGVIASKLKGDGDISHATVKSQEAAKMLMAAKVGETPLAQLLYDLELLRASERVLGSVSTQSSTSYQLLAQIKLAQQPPSSENLSAAVILLKKAINIAPQNIRLHRQLKEVYNTQSKTDAASDEEVLIQLLEKGTP